MRGREGVTGDHHQSVGMPGRGNSTLPSNRVQGEGQAQGKMFSPRGRGEREACPEALPGFLGRPGPPRNAAQGGRARRAVHDALGPTGAAPPGLCIETRNRPNLGSGRWDVGAMQKGPRSSRGGGVRIDGGEARFLLGPVGGRGGHRPGLTRGASKFPGPARPTVCVFFWDVRRRNPATKRGAAPVGQDRASNRLRTGFGDGFG